MIVETLTCINSSTCFSDHEGLNNTSCCPTCLIAYGPISDICGINAFLISGVEVGFIAVVRGTVVDIGSILSQDNISLYIANFIINRHTTPEIKC